MAWLKRSSRIRPTDQISQTLSGAVAALANETFFEHRCTEGSQARVGKVESCQNAIVFLLYGGCAGDLNQGDRDHAPTGIRSFPQPHIPGCCLNQVYGSYKALPDPTLATSLSTFWGSASVYWLLLRWLTRHIGIPHSAKRRTRKQIFKNSLPIEKLPEKT